MHKSGLLIVFVLLVTGCAQQPQTPTKTITPTPPPSATRRPLPPTWTAGPSPTDALLTATSAELRPMLNSTALTGLPPTWTPAPVETVTSPPVVIPTQNATLLALTPTKRPTPGKGTTLPTIAVTLDLSAPPLAPANAEFPAECSTFAVDAKKSTRNLKINNPAEIFFTFTSEADDYQVWVLHPDGRFVAHLNINYNGDLVINGSAFVSAGAYGWELVAFKNGQPVCQHLTGVFIVAR